MWQSLEPSCHVQNLHGRSHWQWAVAVFRPDKKDGGELVRMLSHAQWYIFVSIPFFNKDKFGGNKRQKRVEKIGSLGRD